KAKDENEDEEDRGASGNNTQLNFWTKESICNISMTRPVPHRPAAVRQRLPRSFKELTPARHFKPRTFFREMVWKTLLTRRIGEQRIPDFPKLARGQVAVTWIGHASFLVQFTDLNVLIDPNFANWLFLLKRIKRSGLRIEHLPP